MCELARDLLKDKPYSWGNTMCISSDVCVVTRQKRYIYLIMRSGILNMFSAEMLRVVCASFDNLTM